MKAARYNQIATLVNMRTLQPHEVRDIVRELLREVIVEPTMSTQQIDHEIIQMMKAGQKIGAIKFYRDQTYSSLMESKKYVEELCPILKDNKYLPMPNLAGTWRKSKTEKNVRITKVKNGKKKTKIRKKPRLRHRNKMKA